MKGRKKNKEKQKKYLNDGGGHGMGRGRGIEEGSMEKKGLKRIERSVRGRILRQAPSSKMQ